MGDRAIDWTADLALLLYAAALLLPGVGLGRWRLRRALSTLGLASLVAHVVLAFHLVHGYSHTAAYEETARQTREIVGIDWGGGLWFNYAFVALWGLDTAWAWLSERGHRARPAWVGIALHSYLVFIAVNATIVFEKGLTRGVAIGVLLILVGASVARWRRHAARRRGSSS